MLARLAVALVPFAFVSLGCDADEVAKQCVSAGLVAQCPAGSNPILGASADEGCDGNFSDNVVSGEMGATATCRSSGGCDFMCQFAVPCTCGVLTLTKEEIVCAVRRDELWRWPLRGRRARELRRRRGRVRAVRRRLRWRDLRRW